MASLEEPSAMEEPYPKLVAQLQTICHDKPVAQHQPLASYNRTSTALLEEPSTLESTIAKCTNGTWWTQDLIFHHLNSNKKLLSIANIMICL